MNFQSRLAANVARFSVATSPMKYKGETRYISKHVLSILYVTIQSFHWVVSKMTWYYSFFSYSSITFL